MGTTRITGTKGSSWSRWNAWLGIWIDNWTYRNYWKLNYGNISRFTDIRLNQCKFRNTLQYNRNHYTLSRHILYDLDTYIWRCWTSMDILQWK